MPGKRKGTGKALGSIATVERRRAHFDRDFAVAPSEDAQIRVRGRHLAAAVRNAPPALIADVAAHVLGVLDGLIADIESKGTAA